MEGQQLDPCMPWLGEKDWNTTFDEGRTIVPYWIFLHVSPQSIALFHRMASWHLDPTNLTQTLLMLTFLRIFCLRYILGDVPMSSTLPAPTPRVSSQISTCGTGFSALKSLNSGPPASRIFSLLIIHLLRPYCIKSLLDRKDWHNMDVRVVKGFPNFQI